MVRQSNSGRFLAAVTVACLTLGVAGCQSGGTGSFLNLGGKDNKQAQEPDKGKVLASDLLGYCPKVTLKEETGYFNKYAKGGDGDSAKLLYQASIGDVTRSCSRAGGMLTMNIAVAGRVVPGPAASAGPINMPIRIAVSRGDEVLYSQLHDYQVSLGSEVAQFVFNDPNVVVPIPAERSLRVFAGFDAGPPKKKTQE